MAVVPIIALTLAFGLPAHSLDRKGEHPRFAYRDSLACGSVVAYTWNWNRTEQLVVQFDKAALGVAIGATRSFRIEATRTKLEVWVDLYPAPAHGTHCTDVLIYHPDPTAVWLAKAGKVTIRTFRITEHKQIVPGAYGVEIRIDDAMFEGPDKETVTTVAPIILHGQAGWLPG